MDKRYKHLGSEERGVILAEHRRGSSLREIGLVLGGAAITDEAWSKQRCDASNCSVSASWLVTSTGRWPNYRHERQS